MPELVLSLADRHRSPCLLPKPADWRANISVPGYTFLNSSSSYTPPQALQQFLESGPPPVYIGFGSIVVEHPLALTTLVIEAVKSTGHRVLFATGWSGRGDSADEVPSTSQHTFILQEDCPHDWLFPQVACVVHHGGAGTTAAGLRAGRSTIVIPFFGDQFFWGDIIYRAGAGPQPIPYRSLEMKLLVDAVQIAMRPDVLRFAERIGERIKLEDGIEGAVESFHTHLPILSMACAALPSRTAVWKSKSKGIRLSAVAATVLRKERLIEWSDLELHRSTEHHVSEGAYDPISGAAWAVTELILDSFRGMGEMLTEVGRMPLLAARAVEKVRTVSKGKQRADEEEDLPSYRVAMTEGVSVEHTAVGKKSPDRERHKLPGEYMVTGTLRVGKAAARAAGDFTAGIASGAHNMPRLWGDDTVRPTAKVTGITSGVTSGCKELVLGVYDGLSGVFVQPITGLIEEGPVGFVKGAGKGLLGFPVKWVAGECD
jgi:hypothetical protein